MNIPNLEVLLATIAAFGSLLLLLWWKRIDSDNTVFFACVIVLVFVVAVLALLPPTASDKLVVGLISIGSGVVGFLSRGLVEGVREGKSKKEQAVPQHSDEAPPGGQG